MSYVNQVCGPMKVLDSEPVEGGGSAAPCIISQVEGQAFNTGLSTIHKSSGGQVYHTFTGIMGGIPKFSGSTEALAQFLTALGAEGKVLSTGIELYNQLVDVATGKRAGATSHEKLAFVKALVVPRSLQCSHGGVAKLSFDIFGISSDGVVHPCTISQGVSLPTISGVTEQFTLGAVEILGTTYEGIQDVSIEFGLSEMLKSGGGDIYKKLAYFGEIKPKVTIKSDDKAVLNALSLIGTAQVTTPSVIFFAKVLRNGVRVPNATAQHVSFTINDGMWIADEKGGTHGSPLQTGFMIEPLFDGTNAPFVVSAATAIT